MYSLGFTLVLMFNSSIWRASTCNFKSDNMIQSTMHNFQVLLGKCMLAILSLLHAHSHACQLQAPYTMYTCMVQATVNS